MTKSVQLSTQRITSFKTELSKQLEDVNKHLGDLQEDLTQVHATVEDLVANQTGVSKAMASSRRADEHVTEQGKKFQALDNKLEAKAQLLEELQMKIIDSHGEMRADIDTCKKNIHAWNQRLSKFDMDLWRNNNSGERIKFQVEFEQNMATRLEKLAIAFREHEATNENQIGELTNRLDQAFTEEKEKWQIGKSQNAKGQSKMLNQLRDDTARYKSEAELSKQTASSK